MQAVILAAGLGTRMRELTKDTPKPLLKFGGKSLLEHNLDALPEQIDEAILIVGYKADQIKNLIGENYKGKKITYVVQKDLNGTAGAVFTAKDKLHGRFLVMNGDDIFDKRDLEKLIKNPFAILVSQIQIEEGDADRHATVKVNEAGELIGTTERQKVSPGAMVNAGAYIMNEDIFKYPLALAGNKTKEFGLPQTFLQMISEGVKIAVIPAEKWHKVTSPEDLKP